MANIQIEATYQSGRKEIHMARGPKTLDKKLADLRRIPTVIGVKVISQ